MPIYVFKCEVCGHVVEELRSMGDDKPPELEGPCENSDLCRMQKSMTSPGLNFVGPGWGRTELIADGQMTLKKTAGARHSARWGKAAKKVESSE